MQLWLRRLWRERDPLIAGLVGLGLTAELLARDDASLQRSLPLAAVAAAALLWRRTQPIPAFLACWLALFGLAVVVPAFDNESTTFVFAYFVSIFSLGAHTRGKELAAAVLLVLIGIATFGLTDGYELSAGNITFATFFVGGPWATGLALRLRGDIAESNAQLKREQEERTRRAIAEERATIARELHDVVAHAISVTVLQSRGARRMLGHDDEQVRRALDAIEHTNTQALGDMRRLLAVLRDTEGDAATTPQPSLARLDDLVADVRESGLAVELVEAGDERDVPPGVDLSAYRIIQEALTNVLKHASADHATVHLDYGPDELTLSVRDDGIGTAASNGGGGHGLVGIRERVAVVGGEIETGPVSGGGFEVSARLPYSVEA
ncbi:MAG: sensor histidine kinase [Nocardioides sp.]